MAGPWLSPQVVKRKSVPKLLPAVVTSSRNEPATAKRLRAFLAAFRRQGQGSDALIF